MNFDKLYWFLSMTHKYVNQSWKVQLLGFLPYSATQPNRFIETFTMQAVLIFPNMSSATTMLPVTKVESYHMTFILKNMNSVSHKTIYELIVISTIIDP